MVTENSWDKLGYQIQRPILARSPEHSLVEDAPPSRTGWMTAILVSRFLSNGGQELFPFTTDRPARTCR